MVTMSLAGSWTARQKGGKITVPGIVPGCIHTDLLAAGEIEDPHYGDNELSLMWIGDKDWIYTRTFTVAKTILANDHVDLVCDGLDTFAQITLNGKKIGATDNAFRTWRFDVAKALRAGENTITVTFSSTFPYIKKQLKKRKFAPIGRGDHRLEGSNYVRKSQCNYGWDWGPMCVTCGIWREIRLEAYASARLTSVEIRQDHSRKQKVALDVKVEASSADVSSLSAVVSVRLEGSKVMGVEFPLQKESGAMRVAIPDPKLWWPNGLGEQPLYDVTVTLLDAGRNTLDEWERKIGLRELLLDRHADKHGETFQFVVNGKPFFAKGANWIPADTFVTRISAEQYEHLLSSAVEANMNMLRVWGGGIYEDDLFYELCDRYGICVWQDFMFACSAYPAYDEAFMATVAQEVEDNVRRLRHHASIALWCGNNEIEQIHEVFVGDDEMAGQMTWDEYKSLFDTMIPEKIRTLDPDRPYWPSSPHSPVGDRLDFNNPTCGDAHLWSVWHGREPFEWYRTCEHRFNSEFGFQSFPEPAVAKAYTPEEERNITSFVMEHHQRSGIGNEAIVQYMLSWFRLPTGFEMSLWLSQILQGMAIKYAVEHWRRSMPQGMGTLYWQINDCWPVASWASIDYPGNWKALHYMAREFYAPLLVSAVEDGERGIVDVHVTSDLPNPEEGTVNWALTDTDGTVLDDGSVSVKIPAGKNRRVGTIKIGNRLKDTGSRNLMFWLNLEVNGKLVSRNLATFERPKHLTLKDPDITTEVKDLKDGTFEVSVSAKKPALWTWLELEDSPATYSDRFFHLRPKQQAVVTVGPKKKMTPAAFEKKLKVYSLTDTYR